MLQKQNLKASVSLIFYIFKHLQNLVGKGLCLLRKECIVSEIMKIIRTCNMQRIKYSFKRSLLLNKMILIKSFLKRLLYDHI